MRFLKNFAWLLAGVCVGCLAGRMLLPWLTAERPEDDFAAAQLLLEDTEKGGDGLWFRRDTVNADRVYRALEAQLPYAFTMHCKTYQDGSSELSVEVENRAAQEQAEALARAVAGSLGLEGMERRAQLLALHDWLVVNCAYDLSVGESEALDGASPPFTAAGALVGGKAVCMGYARAYQMLCSAVGIETFFVVSEGMNHAWNGIVLDGQLLFIDCTYDDPVPDRPGVAGHEYFLVDAQALRRTHTWDEEFYQVLGSRFYGAGAGGD